MKWLTWKNAKWAAAAFSVSFFLFTTWYDETVLRAASVAAPDAISGKIYRLALKPDGYVNLSDYRLYWGMNGVAACLIMLMVMSGRRKP